MCIRDSQNVAQTLLAVLENDNTIGKEFEVVDGDTDVTTAVQNL